MKTFLQISIPAVAVLLLLSSCIIPSRKEAFTVFGSSNGRYVIYEIDTSSGSHVRAEENPGHPVRENEPDEPTIQEEPRSGVKRRPSPAPKPAGTSPTSTPGAGSVEVPPPPIPGGLN